MVEDSPLKAKSEVSSGLRVWDEVQLDQWVPETGGPGQMMFLTPVMS